MLTGKDGPDLSAGQGIAPHFLHVRCRHHPLRGWKPLHPLIPQSYSQRVRRFLSATACSPVSHHDRRFECRWRYLWKPGAPPTPGGRSKKKGLFSSAEKTTPAAGPRHHPKTGRWRTLFFARSPSMLRGCQTREGWGASVQVHRGPAAVVPAVRGGRLETAPPRAWALCGDTLRIRTRARLLLPQSGQKRSQLPLVTPRPRKQSDTTCGEALTLLFFLAMQAFEMPPATVAAAPPCWWIRSRCLKDVAEGPWFLL